MRHSVEALEHKKIRETKNRLLKYMIESLCIEMSGEVEQRREMNAERVRIRQSRKTSNLREKTSEFRSSIEMETERSPAVECASELLNRLLSAIFPLQMWGSDEGNFVHQTEIFASVVVFAALRKKSDVGFSTVVDARHVASLTIQTVVAVSSCVTCQCQLPSCYSGTLDVFWLVTDTWD